MIYEREERTERVGNRLCCFGRSFSAVIVTILALLLFSVSTSAQRSTGTLRGQILDPQGAAVSDADVTVTNQDTRCHSYQTLKRFSGPTSTLNARLRSFRKRKAAILSWNRSQTLGILKANLQRERVAHTATVSSFCQTGRVVNCGADSFWLGRGSFGEQEGVYSACVRFRSSSFACSSGARVEPCISSASGSDVS
jgi:hypothetical protein